MFKKKAKLKKEKKKYTKIKVLVIITLFLGSIYLSYEVVSYKASLSDNKEFLKHLIESSNSYQASSQSEKIVTSLVQFFSNVDFHEPSSILSQSSAFFEERDHEEDMTLEEAENQSTFVEDPYPDKTDEKPLVYIYNSHQLEEYSTSNIEPYNITPNVMMSSYILREKFRDQGITSLVEEQNVTELLRVNNWNYASSYKVTKMLMEDAKLKNPSLTYFIDLHRDSVNRSISTATIGDVSYAKIMFLIGLENSNYKENLAFTENINNKLEEKYPGISRGIYKKEGPGVNGVYNQDFSPKTILIEVGGTENTIDEVLHSIEAIADVLGKIIKEDAK